MGIFLSLWNGSGGEENGIVAEQRIYCSVGPPVQGFSAGQREETLIFFEI